MGIITKALLKLNKSPKGIYSVVKKLAPKVIDFAITENQYDATEAIEKELLLSSFLLNFNPAKDIHLLKIIFVFGVKPFGGNS